MKGSSRWKVYSLRSQTEYFTFIYQHNEKRLKKLKKQKWRNSEKNLEKSERKKVKYSEAFWILFVHDSEITRWRPFQSPRLMAYLKTLWCYLCHVLASQPALQKLCANCVNIYNLTPLCGLAHVRTNTGWLACGVVCSSRTLYQCLSPVQGDYVLKS